MIWRLKRTKVDIFIAVAAYNLAVPLLTPDIQIEDEQTKVNEAKQEVQALQQELSEERDKASKQISVLQEELEKLQENTLVEENKGDLSSFNG